MKDANNQILEKRIGDELEAEVTKIGGKLVRNGGYSNGIDMSIHMPTGEIQNIDVKSLECRAYEITLNLVDEKFIVSPKAKVKTTPVLEELLVWANKYKSLFPDNDSTYTDIPIPDILIKKIIVDYGSQHGYDGVMLSVKGETRFFTYNQYIDASTVSTKCRNKKSGSQGLPLKYKNDLEKELQKVYKDFTVREVVDEKNKKRLVALVNDKLTTSEFTLITNNKSGDDVSSTVILSEPDSSNFMRYGLVENEYFVNKTSKRSSPTITCIVQTDGNTSSGKNIKDFVKALAH